MQRQRRGLAMFLLATFVAGGLAVPVLHHAGHALHSNPQAGVVHDLGPPGTPALDEAAGDVAGLHDCYLCHRHLVLDLVPTLSFSAERHVEVYFGAALHGAASPLSAHYPIRAPPEAA